MKHALPLALALILAAPATAHADGWDDYTALMSHYYMVDKDATGPITCHITSTSLDDLMDKVPALGATIESEVEKFRVTVRPDGDISFNLPPTNINFGTYDAAEQATQALTTVFRGTRSVVSGVLEGMVTEKKERITNIKISAKGPQTTANYERDNLDGSHETVETVYSGDTDTTRETQNGHLLESTNKYITLNGKLAISEGKLHRATPGDEIDGTIAIKYQQVGKAYMPARIITDLLMGPKKTPEKLEIDLVGCTSP